MLIEALAIGGLGFVAAAGLGVAAKIFAVETDPRAEAVEENLAGANCGGCGFASCSQAAEAIAAGKAEVNICVAGGPAVAEAVAAVMGVAVVYREPEVAQVDCTYGRAEADLKFEYQGVSDCRAAVAMAGGPKVCEIGCVGLGTCAKVCPFNAITMSDAGLPVVDPALCTGCGTCERNCPKYIIHLTSVTGRILGFNQDYNCLAPCQNTCPAQIDIPGYIRAIAEKRFEDALHIIKEHNPLPICIGRVCPHPCEDMCRRGLDCEPININHLKRFAADYEMNSGSRYKPFCLPKNDRKVAIVGGGPAGLTAGYYLARLGYAPTIYEGMPALGGMMRYGIPEYRLPKKIMDWEIDGILELGVEARLNQRMGEDFSLESLRQDGYEAVFMGVGAWNSRNMRLDGEDLHGVLPGTSMLIDRGLEKETPVGEKVIIIGGGNTAIDCARTCWRLGSKEVTVLYRRSRAEMPANDIEVEEAEHEGIQFHFLAAPTKLIGEDGKLKALEYIQMELGEPDASGRRRPVPVEGSETVLECDNVIAAIGQFPDLDFLEKDDTAKDIALTKWNTLDGNEQVGNTNIPGVFAGGDGVLGAATVVQAIAAGRRAARAIHLYLCEGEECGIGSLDDPLHIDAFKAPDTWVTDPKTVTTIDQIPLAPAPKPRVKMPELNVEQRAGKFVEVELGLPEEEAVAEAQRCLQCGLICYKKDAHGGPAQAGAKLGR